MYKSDQTDNIDIILSTPQPAQWSEKQINQIIIFAFKTFNIHLMYIMYNHTRHYVHKKLAVFVSSSNSAFL